MEENRDIVRLRQPDAIADPLTEVLRADARQVLAQAVELEVEAFLIEQAGLKLAEVGGRLGIRDVEEGVAEG